MPSSPQPHPIFYADHRTTQEVLTISNGSLHLIASLEKCDTSRIFHGLHMRNVHTLTCLCSINFLSSQPSKWRALYSLMPRLSELRITSPTVPLVALAPEQYEAEFPCPTLATVTVSNWSHCDLSMLDLILTVRTIRGLPAVKVVVVTDTTDSLIDKRGQREELSHLVEMNGTIIQRTALAQKLQSKEWPSEAYLWAQTRKKIT